MSLGQVGIGVNLDLSNFDSNITKLNRGLRVLNSSLKATDSAFKNTDNQVDRLSQAGKDLTQMFNTQSRIVDINRQKYDKLSKTTGEFSKETLGAQKALNDSITKLNGYEKRIQGVDKALGDLPLSEFRDDVRVLTSEFDKNRSEIAKYDSEVDKLNSSLNDLTKVYDAQAKVVEVSSQKYEHLRKTKGENNKETKQALIDLNNETRALNEYGSQIDEVNNSLNNMTVKSIRNELDDLSMSLEKTQSKYGVVGRESKNLREQLKTLNDMKKAQTQLVGELADEYDKLSNEKGEHNEETRAAKAALNEEEIALNNLKGEILDTKVAMHELRQETGLLANLETGFTKTGEALQSVGKGVALVGGGLVGATSPLTGFMGYAATSGFKRAVQLNQSSAMLSAAGFDDDDRDTIVDLGVESVTGTPFSSASAISASTGLLSTTRVDLDNLKETLQAIGNATALSGGSASYEEVAGVFNSIATEGRLTRERYNQLQQRSPTTLKALMSYTGLSEEEIIERTSGKGGKTISFDDVVSAINYEYDDAAEKMGEKDIGAAWGNVISNIANAGMALWTTKSGEDGLSTLEYLHEFLLELIVFIKDTVIPVFKELAPPFTAFVKLAVKALSMLMEFFGGLETETQKNVVVIGLLLAALGGAMVALGGFLSLMGWVSIGIGKFFGTIKGVLGFLFSPKKGLVRLLTLLGPKGWLILGIAALVSGIVLFFMKTEKGREIIDKIVQSFKNMWEWFTNIDWAGVWDSIVGAVQSAITTVGEFFVGLWEDIKIVFQGIWDTIVGVFEKVWDVVIGVITWYITTVVGLYIKLYVGIWNILTNIYDFIVGIFTGIWTWITETVSSIVSTVSNFFINLWQGIQNVFTGIWNTITETTSNIFSTIWQWVLNIYNAIYTRFTAVRDKIIEIFTNIWSGITTKTSEIYESIKGWVLNIAERIGSGFTTAKDSVFNILGDMWQNIKDKFDQMVELAKGLPGRIGDGIRNFADKAVSGVKDLGNRIGGTLKGVVNKVIDGVNFVTSKLGIKASIEHLSIPEFSRGTQKHQGGLMTVGDRGFGNFGNGTRELVVFPNGGGAHLFENETTLNAPKGTQVYSNSDTEKILGNRYSRGTAGNDLNGGGLVGSLWDSLKSGAVNVWNTLTNPLELVNDIIGNATDGFATSLAGFSQNMAKGAFNKIKDGVVGFITRKRDEAGPAFTGKYIPGGYRINHPFGRYNAKPGSILYGVRHYGIDTNHVYDPVHSPVRGKVTRTFYDNNGGNMVELYSPGDLYHWFGHMSKFNVSSGDTVAPGDLLGISGNTGRFTTGAHLHYQLMKGGIGNQFAIDPIPYLNGKFSFASGGLINQRGIYELGEEGSEAVVPLNDYSAAMKMLAYINHTLNNKGSKNKRTNQLNTNFNNSKVEDAVVNELRKIKETLDGVSQKTTDNSEELGELKRSNTLLREAVGLLSQLVTKDIDVKLDGRSVAKGIKKDLDEIESIEQSRRRRAGY